jgi:mono/diheme cytochrome c family protein
MTHSSHRAAARRLFLFALIPLLVIAGLLAWPRPGAAQDPVLPAATPEALPGLDLYAERCANCHGDTGQGDGLLIQQAGATPPMPFDAAYISAAQPSVMFRQITDGEAAVGMPPFGPASSDPIDEAGRWNLVAAVFSLATPPEDVTAGQAIYEAECAACHGDAGAGDGPDAATTDPPASPLTDLAYWFNRSNDTVFTELAPGAIPAHAYEIADDDLRRVVDFARTFSYAYADPAILTAPIPAGVVMGVLSNGTTGEMLGEAEVELQGFTPEFEQTVTLTTTTDANGNFRFDVTDVPPDLIFIAGSSFDGLNFSSGANQLDRNNPTLDMPVTVYDKTSDGAGVNVAQLHVVFEFAEERVTVNQLYVVNNAANAVFVGPSGDPADGVFEVAVPEGAENLEFQRSFGSMQNFLPANDFVQTARGWADPLPLRPGDTASTLLVRYDLPFSDGMRIAHPIFYETATTTIILPDAGVSVTNTPWVEQPAQEFGQGQTFRNYSGPGVPAGETISMVLEGRPNVVTDASGAAVVNRDQTTELLIGGGALLLAAVSGVFLWRYWQGRHEEDEEEWAEAVETTVALPSGAAPAGSDDLLRTIAALDDAHDAGQIDDAAYQAQRAELKRQLAAMWKAEG